jgi:hypothetical protein
MSSSFYSSHKAFLQQQSKRRYSKEICYVCGKKYDRTHNWNYKYCSIECEKKYKHLV